MKRKNSLKQNSFMLLLCNQDWWLAGVVLYGLPRGTRDAQPVDHNMYSEVAGAARKLPGSRKFTLEYEGRVSLRKT